MALHRHGKLSGLRQQVKAIILIREIIFKEDKKFALLSQNYRRFALDEPKSRACHALARRIVRRSSRCRARHFAFAALKKRPANLAGLNVQQKIRMVELVLRTTARIGAAVVREPDAIFALVSGSAVP